MSHELILPGKDAKGNGPFVAESVRRFINGVERSDIDDALVQVVGSDVSVVERWNAAHIAAGILIPESMSVIDEMKVDPVSSLAHMLKLNNGELWSTIIERVAQRDPELQYLFVAANADLEPSQVNLKMGDTIANANTALYGFSLCNVSLGALFGNRFSELTNNRLRQINSGPHVGYPNGRYLLGESIGEKFEGIAMDADEYVGRLSYLFQASEDYRGETPVMVECFKNKVFTAPDYESPNAYVTCPARDLTRSIFNSYGELLKDEDYVMYLLDQVSVD